ncbi:MAG: DUF3854 domain-containing protein, partial [Prochloraceae cyanobacterium]|nr:DUF3854 domain-containing protein [Prochloraceae cyanobacterium]
MPATKKTLVVGEVHMICQKVPLSKCVHAHGAERITPEVLEEWRASGVDDDITRLNVRSLNGTAHYSYLLYALPRSERRNDGRLTQKWLNRYDHCNHGGWWCSGIDVLTGEPAQWGQFKPKLPYRYIKKKAEGDELKGFGETPQPKTIKYEAPRKVPTEIYALRVSLRIWSKIAKLNNVPLPDHIEHDPTTGEAKGFWSWVLSNPDIPITITEGAKKAGALLTAGYVAVALPGIWSGLRQPKDEFGHKTGLSFLIPQLKVFAVKGREINFGFDNDASASTRSQVNKAIVKTGKLFEKEGCKVKVVSWVAPYKGVDDFIVAVGDETFNGVYEQRKPLSSFKLLEFLDLSRFVDKTVEERHLDPEWLPPEDAKIIGISSAKNTGKTVWLTYQVQKAIESGRRVIVLTHRIQLARELCHRFKIPYLEEFYINPALGEKGFALCIDSLHADSAAQFNPEDWSGAYIFVDECEQVFWHALNSNTLKYDRVQILTNLETLIKVALTTGGKIYLADADLSPIALQYVQKLAGGYGIKTWVLQNLFLPNLGNRKLFTYNGTNPKLLLAAVINAISNGEKVLIHTSGQKQKSKWGTKNLEGFLKKELFLRG